MRNKINKGSQVRGISQSSQTFIQGAMILTLGMFIVKLVGALFKIPLESVIKEYGMGLFNVAYNFYGPIHSLTIAGLPIAISRMVSKNHSLGRYKDIRKVKKVASPIFVVLGILGTLIMILGTPYYCNSIIGNKNAVLPMLALAPAILFSCLGAVYRGYYEGLKNMYPTAISEIIEAVSKLAIGLSLAVLATYLCNKEFLSYGTIFKISISSTDEAALVTLSVAAAGAILGVTCGSLFSFIFLSANYRIKGDGITAKMYSSSPAASSGKQIAKSLISTAVPIALGSVTANIGGLIDTTFLQSGLSKIVENSSDIIMTMYKGMIPDEYLRNPSAIPNFLYGCYALALTIYMLIPTITQAISTSALPNVTEVWLKKDKARIKKSIESVLGITTLFAFPAGFGISALALPITKLLYGDDPSAPIIASALLVLGFAAALAAISTPLSSMLQAVGRADLPVKILVVAMVIKISVNYVLCEIPEINILGAGVGSIFCYLFVVIAQTILLCRVTKVKISIANIFIKPCFSAAICAAVAYLTSFVITSLINTGNRLDDLICVLISAMSGAVIYAICCLLFIGKQKIKKLIFQKNEKTAKILES